MNSTFKFIKLNKNSKTPIKNEYFKDAKAFDQIDITKYNVGLLAGANNLIILDVDIKDGGLIEWNDYRAEHFEPYTMQQQTPSGGYHYIFKHHDDTYTEEQVELIHKLKNKSKYRGKGLDIRKNNGYIVFSPSIIDDKPYRLLNAVEPQKIPLPLLKWLLEFEGKEKEALNNNLVLMKDAQQLTDLLNKFQNVSSRQWFNITTAIKNLLHPYNNLDDNEVIKIWKNWSKAQEGYHKNNNLKIWESITANINLNFIITQYNKTATEKIELLDSFKPLQELKTDTEKMTMNNKYIYDEQYEGDQFTQDIFNKYHTIIIKSTTGTGKTSNTARHVEQYMRDKPELKFLSLIDRITLSHQHKQTFKNLNAVSYQDEKRNMEDDNIIICLNSLMMYSRYGGDFFKNYIVYIDEITSFLNSLTNNDTLNSTLKGVYVVLMKIINNAHKVIVSDATINDNTFSFLNKRTKQIYIENSFKKYDNITVYKMNDENEFLRKVKEHVKTDNYFLFGCDSKDIIDKYYLEVGDKNEDNKEIITSTEKYEIIDASKQFKNKFIFYSPSITTGIDFNIETAQDVFLYINGRTITPEASFQQLSRTRNINKVYLYINENGSTTAKYNSLEDTRQHFKNISSSHSKISKLCINEIDDEFIFNENTFFNLFCFNEYVIDTFNTNKKQHFLNILMNNGFKVKEKGIVTKLDKTKMKAMKKANDENKEEIFEKHITQEDTNEILKKRFEFLNIIDKDTATQYKEILKDQFKLSDYLNFIRLLKKEETIIYKTKQENNNLTQYKAVYTNYFKISLLWQLEKEMNITRFQFDKVAVDKPLKISDELVKKINVAYRCDQYPTTYNEYIEYYVNKIKHLTGSIKFITSTKKQLNKVRTQVYGIDKVVLNQYLKLYELTDSKREHLIQSEHFNPLQTEPNEKEHTKTEITDVDFIDIIEGEEPEKVLSMFSQFYKNYYPKECVEMTMTDDELISIGWNMTNINNFKLYKNGH